MSMIAVLNYAGGYAEYRLVRDGGMVRADHYHLDVDDGPTEGQMILDDSTRYDSVRDALDHIADKII